MFNEQFATNLILSPQTGDTKIITAIVIAVAAVVILLLVGIMKKRK